VTSLILHHYETSPFSEKMRLILGAKGLAWNSVKVPSLLPKPDVIALTGGYRRTPFLQIDADIYCDTALMCKVVDRFAPASPLYPEAMSGLCEIVAQWADSSFFWIAVPFTIQPVSVPYMFPGADAAFMKEFAADRAAMTPHMIRATIPDGGAQVKIYLKRLENMLGHGQAYLLGAEPCIADFSVVQSLWFMRRSPPIWAIVKSYPRLETWFARMEEFGRGMPSEISSEAAIGIAAAAVRYADVFVEDGAGFDTGTRVSVTPTDYAHDPVIGWLVGLNEEEVVVERVDERAGKVRVHFPRIGFQVREI